jgi:hypothetical protein
MSNATGAPRKVQVHIAAKIWGVRLAMFLVRFLTNAAEPPIHITWVINVTWHRLPDGRKIFAAIRAIDVHPDIIHARASLFAALQDFPITRDRSVSNLRLPVTIHTVDEKECRDKFNSDL